MTTYVYSPLIDCLIETLKHYFTQISSALLVSNISKCSSSHWASVFTQ